MAGTGTEPYSLACRCAGPAHGAAFCQTPSMIPEDAFPDLGCVPSNHPTGFCLCGFFVRHGCQITREVHTQPVVNTPPDPSLTCPMAWISATPSYPPTPRPSIRYTVLSGAGSSEMHAATVTALHAIGVCCPCSFLHGKSPVF